MFRIKLKEAARSSGEIGIDHTILIAEFGDIEMLFLKSLETEARCLQTNSGICSPLLSTLGTELLILTRYGIFY